MTFKISPLCAGVVLALAPWAAAAQNVPNAGSAQRLEREQIERLREDQRLQQAPARPQISVPSAPAAPQASQTRNIQVKGFKVDASEILSPQELGTALAEFENRTLSLADLFQAVDKINRLYDQKQMPTARAFLPPQDIADGVVTIRLVEARLGEIRLSESRAASPDFVRDRLSLKPADLMSTQQLEADLARFNRLHDTQLRAAVQAGNSPGTTDVLLEVIEPNRAQFTLFADNSGRKTTGEERIGASLRLVGVTGNADNLNLSAVTSRGSSSYSAAYALPVTRNDLKLDLALSRGNINVINGAFVPLDIGGRSREFSLGLTQPLVAEPTSLWNLYARAARKTSVSDFGGVAQKPVESMVVSLGVSGEAQREGSAWTLDINANQGVKDLGGEVGFFVLRANAAWLGRFGTRTQLVLRGGLQYSPTNLLPSGEQFQLGGSASVRGYPEGLLSGRRGYLSSVELRYALLDPGAAATSQSTSTQLTGLLFLDHGGAFPFRPAPLGDVTRDDFLTSVGFGVTADWSRSANARVVIGWPLRTNPADAKPRRPRIHATLSYSFP